jgi:hypothetical protein
MAEFLNNFDKNLLEASVNKEDLVEAKKEWQNFMEEKCSEKKTCICKHKINNVRYYLNKYNDNIICCGTVCCNKFNLDKIEVNNKTLVKILRLKKPYHEYHQFSNIQEYLDYAKDELYAFMAKEIESSNFNKLILILNDIDNINKSYKLDIFIENIKVKLVQLIPLHIETEITNDVGSIFGTMTKLGALSRDYQIEKPDINIYKNSIENIVNHITSTTGYSGDVTPKFQEKIDAIIKKIDLIKAQTGKTLILKDFFIEMNEKLKTKIQSIKDANFASDKAKWEAQQKYKKRMAEKYER